MPEPLAGMMVTSNVRLLRPLGGGGMGRVWLAEHLSLRTRVVVKFLAPDLANSPEAVARFSREAAAASQVKSPHVVQMFDHGVDASGAPYIVMEQLEGRDLERHLAERGRLEPPEVAAIVSQLARGLSKAHELGIVHRDVKPSNVFLLAAGAGEVFVKLLDFGVAKGVETGVSGGTTSTGAAIGSPSYMSPEQVVGSKTLDLRSDLWSLGALAYEALTGQKAFSAETIGALALKIHRDPLPVPTAANPLLSSSIDVWFARACDREPIKRFASAREMAEALEAAVDGPWHEARTRTREARRRGWAVAAALVVALGAALAFGRKGTAGQREPSIATEPATVNATPSTIATTTASSPPTLTAPPTRTAPPTLDSSPPPVAPAPRSIASRPIAAPRSSDDIW